jgi:hypothetical protein
MMTDGVVGIEFNSAPILRLGRRPIPVVVCRAVCQRRMRFCQAAVQFKRLSVRVASRNFLTICLMSLVSDTFHSKFNWLSSRGIFGSSSVSENS